MWPFDMLSGMVAKKPDPGQWDTTVNPTGSLVSTDETGAFKGLTPEGSGIMHAIGRGMTGASHAMTPQTGAFQAQQAPMGQDPSGADYQAMIQAWRKKMGLA